MRGHSDRGWAKGGGVVKTETLIPAPERWGQYLIEVRVGEHGWAPLCTIKVRSARHAVTIAQARHPNHRIRSASLWSIEANRGDRLAARRGIVCTGALAVAQAMRTIPRGFDRARREWCIDGPPHCLPGVGNGLGWCNAGFTSA